MNIFKRKNRSFSTWDKLVALKKRDGHEFKDRCLATFSPTPDCLDDGTAIEYVFGNLDIIEKRKVDNHVRICPLCLDLVTLLIRDDDGNLDPELVKNVSLLPR